MKDCRIRVVKLGSVRTKTNRKNKVIVLLSVIPDSLTRTGRSLPRVVPSIIPYSFNACIHADLWPLPANQLSDTKNNETLYCM